MKDFFLVYMLFLCATIQGNCQEFKVEKKDIVSLKYPIDWVSKNVPGYVIFISESADTVLKVLTTFDVQKETGIDNIDEYLNNYIHQIAVNNLFEDFTVKSKRKIIYKGYEAYECLFYAVVQYLPVEWKSIMFCKENVIYKFTTTSLIGISELNKEKTEKIFDSVIIVDTD